MTDDHRLEIRNAGYRRAIDNDQAAVSIAQEAPKIAEINLQVRLKIKQAIQQRSPKRFMEIAANSCEDMLR